MEWNGIDSRAILAAFCPFPPPPPTPTATAAQITQQSEPKAILILIEEAAITYSINRFATLYTHTHTGEEGPSRNIPEAYFYCLILFENA